MASQLTLLTIEGFAEHQPGRGNEAGDVVIRLGGDAESVRAMQALAQQRLQHIECTLENATTLRLRCRTPCIAGERDSLSGSMMCEAAAHMLALAGRLQDIDLGLEIVGTTLAFKDTPQACFYPAAELRLRGEYGKPSDIFSLAVARAATDRLDRLEGEPVVNCQGGVETERSLSENPPVVHYISCDFRTAEPVEGQHAAAQQARDLTQRLADRMGVENASARGR